MHDNVTPWLSVLKAVLVPRCDTVVICVDGCVGVTMLNDATMQHHVLMAVLVSRCNTVVICVDECVGVTMQRCNIMC